MSSAAMKIKKSVEDLVRKVAAEFDRTEYELVNINSNVIGSIACTIKIYRHLFTFKDIESGCTIAIVLDENGKWIISVLSPVEEVTPFEKSGNIPFTFYGLWNEVGECVSAVVSKETARENLSKGGSDWRPLVDDGTSIPVDAEKIFSSMDEESKHEEEPEDDGDKKKKKRNWHRTDTD